MHYLVEVQIHRCTFDGVVPVKYNVFLYIYILCQWILKVVELVSESNQQLLQFPQMASVILVSYIFCYSFY